MYSHDIVVTFQLLGMVEWDTRQNSPVPVIVVDWKKVDQHMARVATSKSRIPLEPECLRWTPLITTTTPFPQRKVSLKLSGLVKVQVKLFRWKILRK